MSESDRLDLPILLVVFNRPDTTKQVLECLEKVRPKRLYVASDGPREHLKDEVDKCEQVKALFNHLDWECTIKTLYRTKNLKGPDAVSQAITWFFSNEERGIILEDDILPNKSFFKYAEELLLKYENNKEIMHISGFNFGLPQEEFKNDYYFSGFVAPCWGWATWKRAWDLFNWEYMNDEKGIRTGLQNRFDNPDIVKYYSQCLTRYNWDYQWMNTIISNNGLGIIPKVNMINNIGFGATATHTKDSSSPLANIASAEINITEHPEEGEFDKNLDNLIYNRLFNPSLIDKFRFKIRKMLKIY